MLVHREVWPGLLNTAEHYSVLVALVSSYWPDRPSHRERRKLGRLGWIGTVDEGSAERVGNAYRIAWRRWAIRARSGF